MILHLHTNRGWGGGEYQVLHLLEGLVDEGVAASLRAREGGLLLARATERGLPALPLVGPWRLPLGEIPLARILARSGVSLLHCHDSRALSLGHRLKRRLRVPLVLSRRVASPLRSNLVSRRKYSAERIDAVIAVCETVKDVLCDGGFPADRVFVAQSGLDLTALGTNDRTSPVRRLEGRPLVAGIGKLAPKKNWPLLIRTAAALQRSGLVVDWVLIGDGPERRTLESAAREAGVEARVRFLGHQPDAERILRECDLLFFPSIREGAAVTVRQAMALGIPVVAVNAPGTAETLDGHGWLVGHDDADGAATAVREVLGNAERREAVTGAARDSARSRFAIERTVEETIRVYRAVLGHAWSPRGPATTASQASTRTKPR